MLAVLLGIRAFCLWGKRRKHSRPGQPGRKERSRLREPIRGSDERNRGDRDDGALSGDGIDELYGADGVYKDDGVHGAVRDDRNGRDGGAGRHAGRDCDKRDAKRFLLHNRAVSRNCGRL